MRGRSRNAAGSLQPPRERGAGAVAAQPPGSDAGRGVGVGRDGRRLRRGAGGGGGGVGTTRGISAHPARAAVSVEASVAMAVGR